MSRIGKKSRSDSSPADSLAQQCAIARKQRNSRDGLRVEVLAKDKMIGNTAGIDIPGLWHPLAPVLYRQRHAPNHV